MSVIYCYRCQVPHDSDFVDCVEDPDNPTEMVCEESLFALGESDSEIRDICHEAAKEAGRKCL